MYAFIGHKSWKDQIPDIFKEENEDDNINVIVHRHINFFHSGEITTLGRIKLHFTDFAISKLIHDHFIEIKK